MTTRRAALDVGTNTVRALVADMGPGLTIVEEMGCVTGLGAELLTTGRLGSEARQRTLTAMAEYLQRARQAGAVSIEAVATAAVREADNAAEFLREVQDQLQLELQVVSGAHEAELSFRGATVAVGLGESQVLVVDLGGGSTEFVLGHGSTLERAQSVALGSRRQTQAAQVAHPVTVEMAAAVRAAVRDLVPDWVVQLPPATPLLGVGGTITQLAALAQQLPVYDSRRVHGFRLHRDAVETQLRRLGAATWSELSGWPGLEAGRAEVMFAGTAMVSELLQVMNREEFLVSTQGILSGLLLTT